MRVAKVSFGVAGRMRMFIDKANAGGLVGDLAEEMKVAVTRAQVAKRTITVELTRGIHHGGLQ